MQLEMKEIEELAEKLNLSKEEILRESLKFFLERKLRDKNGGFHDKNKIWSFFG